MAQNGPAITVIPKRAAAACGCAAAARFHGLKALVYLPRCPPCPFFGRKVYPKSQLSTEISPPAAQLLRIPPTAVGGLFRSSLPELSYNHCESHQRFWRGLLMVRMLVLCATKTLEFRQYFRQPRYQQIRRIIHRPYCFRHVVTRNRHRYLSVLRIENADRAAQPIERAVLAREGNIP